MPRTINYDADLVALENGIKASADEALRQIQEMVSGKLDGVAFMRALKFGRVGRHPVSGCALHVIEHVNQTLTYMVGVAAVRKLRELHAGTDFELLLATESGPDIRSTDGSIAAEIFAAINPDNNRKLKNDVARMAMTIAQNRYVFFSAPGQESGRRLDLEKRFEQSNLLNVEIWCCDAVGSFEKLPGS